MTIEQAIKRIYNVYKKTKTPRGLRVLIPKKHDGLTGDLAFILQFINQRGVNTGGYISWFERENNKYVIMNINAPAIMNYAIQAGWRKAPIKEEDND